VTLSNVTLRSTTGTITVTGPVRITAIVGAFAG
jgi:hypothetical protein